MKNNEEKVKSILNKVADYKKQRGEILTATTLGLCVALSFAFVTNFSLKSRLNIQNNNLANNENQYENNENQYASVEEIKLPSFKSKEELIDVLTKIKDNYGGGYILPEMAIDDGADFSGASATVNSSSIPKNEENYFVAENEDINYSKTNTQVQGVDEADIVKTNGKYIYYLSAGNLYIFNAQDNDIKLEKTIEEIGNKYGTREMYIDNDYIIVLSDEDTESTIKISNLEDGGNTLETNDSEYIENTNKVAKAEDTTYIDYKRLTVMKIYDINSYKLVKTVKTEGDYITSRKIGSNIYIVTNKYLYPYSINERNIVPVYYDSCKDNNFNDDGFEVNETDNIKEQNETLLDVPVENIKYFSDLEKASECSYMIITSMNLDNIDSEATIDVYLGAGNEVYCSKENLYVTKIEYNVSPYENIGGIAIMRPANVTEKTDIHKFKLEDGKVKYIATGEVPGSLLNQYSMDENNSYFRITTTSNDGNSLYVLNEKLELVGKLENLAKGERIYATRFMGDKCYLVTYKTTDPLFVIDLSNPENPTVLGELKLPGYSSYLHPLGDNYLIGFGNESIEKSYKNWKGEDEVVAYDVGLKLAIFDVTDLNNPKELYTIKLGGRGSTSELLYNPKVLYFDKEKGIFALPARLTEETKYYSDGTPMYGKTEFDGVLVYDLSVENGISLRGTIEHEAKKDVYTSYSNIERVLSINDTIYTVSSSMLKATNLETMKESAKIEL